MNADQNLARAWMAIRRIVDFQSLEAQVVLIEERAHISTRSLLPDTERIHVRIICGHKDAAEGDRQTAEMGDPGYGFSAREKFLSGGGVKCVQHGVAGRSLEPLCA